PCLVVIVRRELLPQFDAVGFGERADDVDANVVPAPFQRGDFRQPTDGFLGGGVSAPLRLAAGARARAQVDDRTTTGLDHQGIYRLHEQKAGARPDVVAEGEVFSRDVDERL